MNAYYPPSALVPAGNTKLLVTSSLVYNKIVRVNGKHTFEILTDEQALTLAYQGVGGITYPLNYINELFGNEVPMTSGTDRAYTTNYLDLFPIRNLSLISNTLGNNNSMSINGEWGILRKIPVSAGYNEMLHDRTVLGMDYLDSSGQTLPGSTLRSRSMQEILSIFMTNTFRSL